MMKEFIYKLCIKFSYGATVMRIVEAMEGVKKANYMPIYINYS